MDVFPRTAVVRGGFRFSKNEAKGLAQIYAAEFSLMNERGRRKMAGESVQPLKEAPWGASASLRASLRPCCAPGAKSGRMAQRTHVQYRKTPKTKQKEKNISKTTSNKITIPCRFNTVYIYIIQNQCVAYRCCDLFRWFFILCCQFRCTSTCVCSDFQFSSPLIRYLVQATLFLQCSGHRAKERQNKPNNNNTLGSVNFQLKRVKKSVTEHPK